MERPKRKHPRLKEYDYSLPGAYFVTVCSYRGKALFSQIAVGRGLAPAEIRLTETGLAVERNLLALPERYSYLTVDCYAIMPNHIHMLLRFHGDAAGASPRPTLADVICAFKSLTVRELRQKIWQDSFYEEVVRGQADYERVWTYITENPAKWAEDAYYIP